jgi:hypothetical protein
MRQQRKIRELGWSLFNQVPSGVPNITLVSGIMSATGLQFNQYRDSLSLLLYGAVLTGVTAKPRRWLRFQAWSTSTTPFKPTAISRGAITGVTRVTGGITISKTSTSIITKETTTKLSLLDVAGVTTGNVVIGDAENALARL